MLLYANLFRNLPNLVKLVLTCLAVCFYWACILCHSEESAIGIPGKFQLTWRTHIESFTTTWDGLEKSFLIL
jgi:hypothetical protein